MLTFQNTNYLPGLLIAIPLALLFWSVLRWKAKTKKAFGDEALVTQLTRNYSPRLFFLKFIIVLIAIIFCILALANLRKPQQAAGEKKGGVDVIIALDVSKSMWSRDAGISRLEKAKQFIHTFIDKADNNRIGLVVFAGQAYLQLPLTDDAAMTKMFVDNASPDAVPVQGTDIAKTLTLCNQSLDTKEKKFKAVVLISDGEDHDPNAQDAAKLLRDNGVVLYTVGVGSVAGAPIIEPGSAAYKRDKEGRPVLSKLNERELRDIAALTNGTYYYLDNIDAVASKMEDALDSMEKKVIIDNARNYMSFYPFMLVIAIVLLTVELFIPEVKIINNKNNEI